MFKISSVFLLFKIFLGSFILVLLANDNLFGQNQSYSAATSVYNFTANGNLTGIPAGTVLKIECWGAGGGGGGAYGDASYKGRASGGSGGSYSRLNSYSYTSGGTLSVTVGSGGNGGSGFATGTAGGNSFVGSLCLAKGGSGGGGSDGYTYNNGGISSTSGNIGDQFYLGGHGYKGNSANTGGGGGGAGSSVVGSGGNSTGTTTGRPGGAGGSGNPSTGNGGDGASFLANGNPGVIYGGGGGGARTETDGFGVSKTGGKGANGYVRITIIPSCTVSAASTSPNLCVSTLMTSITHTTSGVTGITSSSGLPTGVTAAYASNAITISGTPSVSGTFNYTITPTGCATVATGTITVNPALPASLSIAANPSTNICAGTSVTFTATPTNGGASPSYQWKVNGTNVGTGLTYTSTTLANNDVVTCVMTSNASPCLTGSPATSNSITMTVNPNLPASVSIAATPGTNVCIGTNVTFTATPTNGGTPSYQWKLDGSNVGTGPTYSNNALTNTSAVTCVMTSTATCATGSPVTSNSISGIVPAAPTAISGTASAVCQVPAGSGWVRFLDGTGRLVVSINPGSNNLGLVTADAYDHGSSVLTQACNTGTNPSWTTAVLGRSWRITPTNNLGASLELPFEDGEMSNLVTASSNTASNPRDNVTSRGDLKMSRYSGASQNGSWSDNCADGGTSLIASQLGNGLSPAGIATSQYVQFATPGFSEFWLHGNTTASPLPITLTNFGASCNEKGDVALNWATASEQNASHFVIERSRDLVTWNVVSTLPAGGNTTTEQLYALTDVDALGGVSYYRLVQVDFDGESEIYGPIAVTCESTEGNSMTVFPNPTKADFTVEITSISSVTNATLQLTDLTGKVIASRQVDLVAGKNQLLFSDLDLQMGTYIVRMQSELEIRPVKLVVNR